ncbi:SET methyltransferase domain containing protein [Nitzschia inconspicua]|uniref:SET methyltransferase domain containing protein n=1 Tax=Nitzschia inconspicua TaxID=303405 RepID=A0A9K3KZI0_9STRA|nr:SET methyltransferase domain containing protein [Nitzschia inconspicua]
MDSLAKLLLQCAILTAFLVNSPLTKVEGSFDESTSLPEFTALVDWIRSHEGGFVDDRLAVLSIPLDNSNSTFYRGIFTTGVVRPGERLCYIPWATIIGPGGFRPEFDAPLVDTVFHLSHELKYGETSPFAPYLKVIGQQQITNPSSWSLSGRALFQQMLGDVLPPHHFDRNVEWFVQHYGMHSDLMKAFFWVSNRAMQADTGNQWLLVPLVDQYNHHSDDGKVNTARFASRGNGFEVIATKFVQAGSELYTKYWGDHTHFFFEEFGFVEEYPQRWEFDLRHVGGSVLEVRLSPIQNATNPKQFLLEWFTDTPDTASMDIMQRELMRLQEFERVYLKDLDSYHSVPKTEKDLILRYHRALMTALNQVVVAASAGERSEEECIVEMAVTCLGESRRKLSP